MKGRPQLSRVRWILIGLIATFVVVQWSPYAGLAAIARHLPLTTTELSLPGAIAPSPGAELLAQLQSLPKGRVGLPNFDPTEDTFQFSNRELIEAIDLERNAPAWEEVLTDQMEQIFGTQVCMGETSDRCVLTAAARDWLQTQLERMNLGIAEGIAAAALALWQPDQPRQIPWWQRLINFLVGQVVFGLARTLFDLQTFIANFFLMQSVTEVFQLTQAVREGLSPTQIFLTLLDVFLSGAVDPFTMGIYRVVRGVLTEGHSLTPYRIEARGNDKYWVYVYDSNYPMGRATMPSDLHVEFDLQENTWRYQPSLDSPAYEGTADSHNLDLTQLSWRQVEKQEKPLYRGPFTCPFCRGEAMTAAAPSTIDITLVGEGFLTVAVASAPVGEVIPVAETAAQVPFRGGLNRAVPASYQLSAERLNQPLKITLEGKSGVPSVGSTLQLVGPGYTADFGNLLLSPDQALTLFVVPTATGPELTFLAAQAMEMPHLSISLTDTTTSRTFDSSTAEAFMLTDRQVSRSAAFELSGLKLPAGKRVAFSAKEDLKRLYFADDDGTDSEYGLTVKNRMVIRDRVQVGERRPDFLNYSLTYEEEMRVRGIQVDRTHQAFFDYNPNFVDPAERSRQELLTAFEQRDFPVAIAYEPLSTPTESLAPLRLVPSGQAPIRERIFSGAFRKSGEK